MSKSYVYSVPANSELFSNLDKWFTSLRVAEAEAAAKADLATCLLERDGNAPLSQHERQTFTVIPSFDELVLPPQPHKKPPDTLPVKGE